MRRRIARWLKGWGFTLLLVASPLARLLPLDRAIVIGFMVAAFIGTIGQRVLTMRENRQRGREIEWLSKPEANRAYELVIDNWRAGRKHQARNPQV